MALARSMSLNINTSAANSLFGSGTAPASGMFGSAQASKPATGLFGQTTSSAPSGLFGSTTTTSAPQSGGLFGSTASTQPQSTGLFGSTPAQTGGGLFGGSTNTLQTARPGGLFGGANTSQPAQTGGIFGSNTGANQSSQPQQSSGMFSNLGSNPSQSGGLFGNPQNQQNQQNQPSMFSSLGQSQNNQGPTLGQNQGIGLLGSTLGGGMALGQNNQQTVPGVKIDMTNIRGTTRFADLHESIQKEIESIDAVIQSQIQLKNECEAIMPAHDSQLAQVPNDVEFCRRKLIGVQTAATGDVYAINLVKKYVDTDVQNAKLSFKAIDNLKLPPQYHNPGIWSAKASSSNQATNGEGNAQDMVAFFSNTADELSSTLSKYQKHIVEIEQHLRGVEANSGAQLNMLIAKKNGSVSGTDDPYEQLTGALRDFEESLLGVAANVGAAREGIQGLQLGLFSASTNGTKNGPRSGVY